MWMLLREGVVCKEWRVSCIPYFSNFNLMFLLILVLFNRHAQQTNKIHFICWFIVQLHGHQLPNAENACSMDH